MIESCTEIMKTNTSGHRDFPRPRGLLIAEAVVASFIMIFAFIASARLFDASLKWEAKATAMRTASLVAEKRMEQLRAWSETAFSSAPFDDPGVWAAEIGAPAAAPTPDPDASGVTVKVLADLPTYQVARLNVVGPAGPPPPPGFYSPTSHFYAPFPAGTTNFQKHPEWMTYPYARIMNSSVRKVQVSVFYNNGAEEYRLLSYIADPITAPRTTPVTTWPQTPVKISRSGGPANLTDGATQEYTVEFEAAGGHDVPDVTALWTLDPQSTGAVIIRPQDAGGRVVDVIRPPGIPGSATTKIRLAAKVRYRGKEIVGYSDEIDYP